MILSNVQIPAESYFKPDEILQLKKFVQDYATVRFEQKLANINAKVNRLARR